MARRCRSYGVASHRGSFDNRCEPCEGIPCLELLCGLVGSLLARVEESLQEKWAGVPPLHIQRTASKTLVNMYS